MRRQKYKLAPIEQYATHGKIADQLRLPRLPDGYQWSLDASWLTVLDASDEILDGFTTYVGGQASLEEWMIAARVAAHGLTRRAERRGAVADTARQINDLI